MVPELSRRSLLLAGPVGLAASGWLPGTASATWSGEDQERPTRLERADRRHLLDPVGKQRPLTPRDYAPPDLVPWQDDPAYQLRAEVADQLGQLFAAAEADRLALRVISAYRSYETQAETYASWVRAYGRASADATSARPGRSEHQTGLAVDLDTTLGECYLDACFGRTAEGRWVARHAYRFGFIRSYPKGYRDRTGYAYEPWHIRYVGPQVARAMHRHGVALLQDYVSPPHSSARLGWMLGTHP